MSKATIGWICALAFGAIIMLGSWYSTAFGVETMREGVLWEPNSTYKNNFDTCAFISDTTAADSVMLYDYWGPTATGKGVGVIVKFDSTGVGDSTWAQSFTITAAPRIRAKSNDSDGRALETLWDEALTLQTIAGTLCSAWSPTAERFYILTHQTWWQEMCVEGIAIKIKVNGATDACYVLTCRTRYVIN